MSKAETKIRSEKSLRKDWAQEQIPKSVKTAEESIDDLSKFLIGSDMVFITAGMEAAPAPARRRSLQGG